MKKTIFLILSIFLLVQAKSQYRTIAAEKINGEEKEGFYYYLPKTLLKIEVKIKKETVYKGPLSKYTSALMNTDDYIAANSANYSIEEASISSFSIPDEKQLYYVEKISNENTKQKDRLPYRLKINLDESGIMKGVGMKKINEQNVSSSQMEVDFINLIHNQKKMIVDTIKTMIQKDSNLVERTTFKKTVVEKSEKEVAEDIFSKIQTIDQDIYDLLSGYQEVPYDGSAIVYMHKELLKLKREYEALFLGKKRFDYQYYTFYIEPKENKDTENISRFSESQGIGKGSVSIQCKVNVLNSLATKPGKYFDRALYVRHPLNATVSISYEGRVLTEKNININQFGQLTQVPFGTNFTEITLDSETGTVIELNID